MVAHNCPTTAAKCQLKTELTNTKYRTYKHQMAFQHQSVMLQNTIHGRWLIGNTPQRARKVDTWDKARKIHEVVALLKSVATV